VARGVLRVLRIPKMADLGDLEDRDKFEPSPNVLVGSSSSTVPVRTNCCVFAAPASPLPFE
jgi:hypothetical protein